MTKSPNLKDTLVLEVLSNIASQNRGEQLDDIIGQLVNRGNVVRTFMGLETHGAFDGIDIAKRFLRLRNLAQWQCQRIVHAGRLFLESKGLSPEEMAPVLEKMGKIRRQFGMMGDFDSEFSPTADEQIVNLIFANPYKSFNLNNDELVFSEEVGDFIRQNTRAETGCPAASVVVVHAEGRTNLYDVFWQRYTGQYIEGMLAGEEYLAIPPGTIDD